MIEYLPGVATGLILAVSAYSTHAQNPEYRCEPGTVDNDAVVVTYADVDVGRFSDPNNKICTFAIGGASADGSLSRNEQLPLRTAIDAIDEVDLSGIVLRLTLARSAVSDDLDNVRSEIVVLFEESGAYLALPNCFRALDFFFDPENIPEPMFILEARELVYLSLEDFGLFVSCSVIGPGDDDRLRSAIPTLHLRVGWPDGEEDSLFVPRGAVYE